jgi:hypothetical protein
MKSIPDVRRPSFRQLMTAALSLMLCEAVACIPYTVGSTAQTVPANQTTTATSWYFIPNAFKHPGDSIGAPLAGSDFEIRYGIDAFSDVGVRALPGGAVANYKHRFGADTSHTSAAVAFITGAGIVNSGEHLHFEATLIASAREDATIAPYGGVRVMQVVPISAGAVNDSPTAGVFGGVTMGDWWFSIRPELGVFYDRSALHLRQSNFIVVPAITLQRRHRNHEESNALRLPALPTAGGTPAPTTAPFPPIGVPCRTPRCS